MSSKKTGHRLDGLELNMVKMAKMYEQILDFVKIFNVVNERMDKLEKEFGEWKKGYYPRRVSSVMEIENTPQSRDSVRIDIIEQQLRILFGDQKLNKEKD